MRGVLRAVRIAAWVLLALLLLVSTLQGNAGAAAVWGLLMVAFVLLTDTFGARTWIFRLLASQSAKARGGEGTHALTSPELPAAVVKRNELKAALSSLPEPYRAAIDSLADSDVDQLVDALRRLRLESGGALLPRRGEAVIGYRRDIRRYKWKSRTIRQGGGGGWGWSLRLMWGLYMHRWHREPTTSIQVQELEPVDTGTLYLTSERIVFDGDSNISVWFDRLDILPQWSKQGFLVLQRGERDVLLKVGGGKDAMAWAVVTGFLVTWRRNQQGQGTDRSSQ